MPKRGRLSSPGPSRRVHPQPKCALCKSTRNLVVCGRCGETYCNNGRSKSHIVFHLEGENFPKSIIVPPSTQVLSCYVCSSSTDAFNLAIIPNTNRLVCIRSTECLQYAQITVKETEYLISDKFVHSSIVPSSENVCVCTDRPKPKRNEKRITHYDSFNDHYVPYWQNIMEKDLIFEQERMAKINIVVFWQFNTSPTVIAGYFVNSDVYHSNLFHPETLFYLDSGSRKYIAKIKPKLDDTPFNHFYFELENPNQQALTTTNFRLSIKPNEETYKRVNKVFDLINSCGEDYVLSESIVQSIVSGKFVQPFDTEKRDNLTLEKQNDFDLFGTFEVEQNEAYVKAHSEAFLLVNGGPGTGKSHVAIALIMDFLLLYPEVKILVTAPTNQALESLFIGLLEHPYYRNNLFSQFNQVIFPSNTYLHSGRTNDTISQFYMDNLIQLCRQNSNNDNNNEEKNDETIAKEILMDVRLVFATLFTAGHQLLNGQEFQIVIVDDVAQAKEPETIIPLQYGCKKLILLGDLHQLNPLVDNTDIQQELGFSMFNRLYSYNGNDQVPWVRLIAQNRMRPSLMNFVGEFVYGKKAEYYYRLGEVAKNKQWPPVVFPFPNENEQFVWLNVAGEETNALSPYSMINQKEIDILEQVYSKMLALDIAADDIGIFAAYKSQAALIQTQFKLHFPQFNQQVYTIDTVQGMEKKYVLISLVRNGEHIGFMNVLNRVSTALSRAEEGLIIVGNGRTFYTSEVKFWERLIKYMDDKNTIVNANAFLEQLN